MRNDLIWQDRRQEAIVRTAVRTAKTVSLDEQSMRQGRERWRSPGASATRMCHRCCSLWSNCQSTVCLISPSFKLQSLSLARWPLRACASQHPAREKWPAGLLFAPLGTGRCQLFEQLPPNCHPSCQVHRLSGIQIPAECLCRFPLACADARCVGRALSLRFSFADTIARQLC